MSTQRQAGGPVVENDFLSFGRRGQLQHVFVDRLRAQHPRAGLWDGAEADALEVRHRLISALRAPYEDGGEVQRVSASVGAGIYPAHGLTADELLRHADPGLYAAKRTGRDRVVIYREGPEA